MAGVVLALDDPRASVLADVLAREGIEVDAVLPPEAVVETARREADDASRDPRDAAIAGADTVVLHATRFTLTAAVIALADRHGVRLVPLCDDPVAARLAVGYGLAPLPVDVGAQELVRALRHAPGPAPADRSPRPEVVVVWGPAGAPGRSTIAVETAVELARRGRQVALVDADAHAPSLALALGMAEEGPGFAAACRQAGRGGLDIAELVRVSAPLAAAGVRLDVLTGINRPSRWPELGEERVRAALSVCRDWADVTVVDVAASLERDEEIVSDLEGGPRRNAATLGALGAADRVVAVLSADPVGVARFVRAHSELRAHIGAVPVTVLANRLRPGALGLDARGQVRRALDRFAGIDDVRFVPHDARAADAALREARPVAEIAPRSPLVQGVRRMVAEALLPSAAGGGPERDAGGRRAGRARRAEERRFGRRPRPEGP